MEIKYISIQAGGRLQAYNATEAEAKALTEKIWDFTCTQRKDPLAPFHTECVMATAYQPQNNLEQEDGSFRVLGLFSSYHDGHKPYLEILQRELNLTIENL